MNYLREINAFLDWLETNPLDAITQALWFHIMGINNKCNWLEWFTVANLSLQAKLGVDKKTIIKHRNILMQKGRIEYKTQGKTQAGKYRIIKLSDDASGNIPPDRPLDRPLEWEPKQGPLIKLKETKPKEDIIYPPEFEEFWTPYLNKTGKKDAFKAWSARLKEKILPDDMIQAAKNYMAECKRKGTETQYMKHPKTFLGPGGHIKEWLEKGQAPEPQQRQPTDDEIMMEKLIKEMEQSGHSIFNTTPGPGG